MGSSKDISKPFTFNKLVNYLNTTIKTFPDPRTGKNVRFSMENIGLGAFSIFFTQNPSFLSFQRYMQETKGKNNAQSLFGIKEIPSDNHIRTVLDEVAPSYAFPVFKYIIDGLKESGHLNNYRSFKNNILIALDATQYFSSDTIHCKNCTKKELKRGKINYSHSVITPVIVKPGDNTVISLQPEFIIPQDGHKKQDCETAAGKRWLQHYGPQYKKLGITILGDDLYSRQPFCEEILKEGLNFILVCKPESHKTLYEWIAGNEVQKVINKRWTGKDYRIDKYRFINQAPLREGDDALLVNWCELTTTKQDGTIVYRNSFITMHEITKKNVAQIVEDGRARWKVENENNNTLKTKGYNFEHNYGHGKKNLSALLVTFNILAFLFHTLLHIMDDNYQELRKKLPTRKTFFNDIRALTKYWYFESWNDLLKFMIRGLNNKIPVFDTS